MIFGFSITESLNTNIFPFQAVFPPTKFQTTPFPKSAITDKSSVYSDSNGRPVLNSQKIACMTYSDRFKWVFALCGMHAC